LRRNEEEEAEDEDYYALFEKREAPHDGIIEKIDSLPRNTGA
jgi:hypothetical protein